MLEKRALVVGLGVSGKAAVKFLLKQGCEVFGTDSKKELLTSDPEIAKLLHDGMVFKHDSEIVDLSSFDCLVVSPGVPPSNRLYQAAREIGIPILGEAELGLRNITNRCLGITGTNGKTTVTLLVAHILNHAGKKAQALGNVGLALTAAECDPDEIFVIELSSFQIETLHSKVLDAAVLLNITPDHLDRYPSMDDYAKAKIQMADLVKSSGVFYIEERCSQQFAHLLSHIPHLTYGFSPSCHLYSDLQYLFFNKKVEFVLPCLYQGKVSHDTENLMAAYLLCKHCGITPNQFLAALPSFKKPSHRIQFIRTINEIDFYDDSKGTNLDAVMRAVESIDGHIHLIAGGVDKGAAYTPWINSFGNRVKKIFAIGQAAPLIKTDMAEAIPVELCTSLEEATQKAFASAKKGDKVLLSPGCSSYDMFRDYAHRGQEFQRIVKTL